MSHKILFFGSGPVAAESLRLLAQDFEVEAVVTKAAPAHHKGEVPVLELAQKLKLPVLTVNTGEELHKLFTEQKPSSSELAVLIDFGIMVPKSVIDYFPRGIVNSHFSLLPQWRGADPITYAVLSGQAITGVSLMLLVEAMDEGPILIQGEYELSPTITTPDLTNNLVHLSHMLLKTTLPDYLTGLVQAMPQDTDEKPVTYSKKLSKDDGVLDWSKPADQLEREVRAYAGWPRSRTEVNGIPIIVTKAHVASGKDKPGKLWKEGKEFGFYTGNGIFVIDKLIPAGKKEMAAAAFLAGYKI